MIFSYGPYIITISGKRMRKCVQFIHPLFVHDFVLSIKVLDRVIPAEIYLPKHKKWPLTPCQPSGKHNWLDRTSMASFAQSSRFVSAAAACRSGRKRRTACFLGRTKCKRKKGIEHGFFAFRFLFFEFGRLWFSMCWGTCLGIPLEYLFAHTRFNGVYLWMAVSLGSFWWNNHSYCIRGKVCLFAALLFFHYALGVWHVHCMQMMHDHFIQVNTFLGGNEVVFGRHGQLISMNSDIILLSHPKWDHPGSEAPSKINFHHKSMAHGWLKAGYFSISG